MIRVSIAGSTGYAGAELSALLGRHPRVDVVGRYSGSDGDAPFSVERILNDDADAVFLATPNEVSAAAVPRLIEAGLAVLDLSGAYRLPDAGAYPLWYGFEHPAPALLPEAVYGLTEWCENLPGARLVANPGCYPTSVLLALKPLAPLLSPEAAVICNSASGVSGAGKRSDHSYSFAEVAGNYKAYGVGTHRHEPEIRHGLGLDASFPFVFVAHLLPSVRGILSTIHVELSRPVGSSEVAEAYASAYRGSAFVRVFPPGELPELRHVTGTPRAAIGFVLLEGGRRAVVVSVLDNLLKGAASQAVQNFNLVFGLKETEGLA